MKEHELIALMAAVLLTRTDSNPGNPAHRQDAVFSARRLLGFAKPDERERDAYAPPSHDYTPVFEAAPRIHEHVLVPDNPYCGKCGAGIRHAIHTRED